MGQMTPVDGAGRRGFRRRHRIEGRWGSPCRGRSKETLRV